MSMSAAVAGIDVKRVREALGSRTIVLVGLMGAGKSSIGRRLAHRLGLPFVDADTEIEKAADLTIPEIFEKHGFIWGGKWDHFDTMHFEYRPELCVPQAMPASGPAAPSTPPQ